MPLVVIEFALATPVHCTVSDEMDQIVKRMNKLQRRLPLHRRYDWEEIQGRAGEERDQHEQIECLYSNVREWLPRVKKLVKKKK
jgi:hypothetical protein